MARTNEVECIEVIRDAYFNGRHTKVCFCNADRDCVKKILTTCVENPSPNDFPDFLYGENGGLEHFLVGSAKEDKKGSRFKQEEHANQKDNNDVIEKERQSYLDSPIAPGSYRTIPIGNVYENFTHQDFLVSLNRHVASHVESLKKSVKNFDSITFVAEQQTARMTVYQNGCFSHFYQLYCDKEALKILEKYSCFVRYFIYVAVDAVEIIDLAKIASLLENAKQGEDIRGGRLIQSTVLFFGDIGFGHAGH